MKPLYLKLGAIVLLILSLWWLRIDILKGIGNYLDDGEEAVPAQRIFVLGGGSYDRGSKAARLWYQGFAPQIICTGDYISGTVKTLGFDYTEAEITRMRVLSFDIDSNLVIPYSFGSSTMEESDLILALCKKEKWNKIIIVSDVFHTKRIRNVFEKKYLKEGIQTIIIGAPSSRYKEDNWWNYERGLIMVNNEYLKHLYYWWKY